MHPDRGVSRHLSKPDNCVKAQERKQVNKRMTSTEAAIFQALSPWRFFLTRLDIDPFWQLAHLDVRAVDREVDAVAGEMEARHLDPPPQPSLDRSDVQAAARRVCFE